MKLKQLLILGALLLSGSASAAIVDGVRQAPAMPEPIDAFTDGQTSMYMYNVGAGKFFCGGNAWGTQTSVSETGYRVYFEQYIAEGAEAWDGTTVYFRDSCLAKSGAMKDVFFDNASGGCFVDRGSQGNYWWKLEKNTDNAYYRLSMAEANPNYQDWQVLADSVGRTYWGWDSANGTVISSFLNPANEGIHVDWAFCTIPAYDAYQVELGVYKKAQELKTAIDDAESRGADVTAQKSVYLNEAATTEELTAAIDEVRVIIDNYVDPNKPVDKTFLLKNPDFASNNSNWSGTSQGWENGVVEVYQGAFDTYQKVSGLADGVYSVGVQSFLRTGWVEEAYASWAAGEDIKAVVYASNGVDSVTTKVPSLFAGSKDVSLECGNELTVTTNEGGTLYVPNMGSSADAYFKDSERGPNYVKNVLISVNGGELKVGTALRAASAGYWFVMDNWTLSFLGSKPEAYQMVLDNALPNALVFGEDVVCTEGMVEAYYEAVEGLKTTKVTNHEELSAALTILSGKEVAENVTLWSNYKDSVAMGLELIVKGYVGEPVDLLGDYVEFDAEDILSELALTSEELKAEMAKLSELIEGAKRCVLPGTDVTKDYIYNYDFENTNDTGNDGKGWEGNWTAYGGPADNKCMEAYAIKWDTYQEVKDAPVGLYEVSLQGFYRVKRGNDAFAMYQNGEQTCPGSVYINNNYSPVKCVFDEPVSWAANIYSGSTSGAEGAFCQFEDPAQPGDSLCFPNDMATAGEAFTAGMYQAAASGVVAKAGDSFKIGVKGEQQTDTWVIWDNFKLVYWGKQADKVLPHLEKAIEAGKANLEKSITKDVYELVNAAIAEGETAIAAQDGNGMFDALVKLYDSNDSVNAVTVILDATLAEAENLFQAAASAVTAPESVVAEAYLLAGEVMDAIDARELTTQAAENYRKKMNLMLITLRLPDTAGASDDNAIDVTSVLDNPDFGDMLGVNTVDGWDGATGSFGNDDTQKATMAYEYYQKVFDMSQTVIGGLPNGTYRVEVQAFGRLGGSQDDFDAFIHNPDTMSAARPIIYAYSTTDSLATYKAAPVNLYGSAALTEDLAGEGTASLTDANGNTFYTPNSMVSTSVWFNAGYYNNVLYVDVTDGTLCLGMKKEAYNTNDWVMMDSWKLFYLGTNSAYDIQNVVAADGQVVSVSVYGANGAQLNGMKKGLNIIRTVYANGAVKVKKVMVK